MKKKILLLLLCIALLVPLASCAEKHELLYSEEHDGITYCVRGKQNTAMQVVVKEGDKVLWSQTVNVDKSVGNLDGDYGLEIRDLNFDGHLDLMIAEKVDGDCVSYLCWLKDPEKDTYQASDSLSGLVNIKADEKLKAIFGFSHSLTYEQEYGDAKASAISTDTATKYVWERGSLIPHTRVSLTYYERTDRYCYSVSYYNEITEEFDDSNDIWLTPEEYQEEDMSFLYYFR